MYLLFTFGVGFKDTCSHTRWRSCAVLCATCCKPWGCRSSGPAVRGNWKQDSGPVSFCLPQECTLHIFFPHSICFQIKPIRFWASAHRRQALLTSQWGLQPWPQRRSWSAAPVLLTGPLKGRHSQCPGERRCRISGNITRELQSIYAKHALTL